MYLDVLYRYNEFLVQHFCAGNVGWRWHNAFYLSISQSLLILYISWIMKLIIWF